MWQLKNSFIYQVTLHECLNESLHLLSKYKSLFLSLSHSHTCMHTQMPLHPQLYINLKKMKCLIKWKSKFLFLCPHMTHTPPFKWQMADKGCKCWRQKLFCFIELVLSLMIGNQSSENWTWLPGTFRKGYVHVKGKKWRLHQRIFLSASEEVESYF